MSDAVRYQDMVRSESGYLKPISCKDDGGYNGYIKLDTLRDSSPVSTDHAVNASKSEEQPVYHTIGKPDRNRIANTIKENEDKRPKQILDASVTIANTIKENEDKRPKQILDASATKKLKVLCIVSLVITIVITVVTVALVYILVILIYSIHFNFLSLKVVGRTISGIMSLYIST